MDDTLERFTTTTDDGTELAIQRSGSGPVLLMLPGQQNSHVWWTEIRKQFEPHFTTLTFDYRGAGDTKADEEQWWSMGIFGEDAEAVLDAVGADKAFVYGTSMGGRVGQVLAGTTDRVEKLVLACTNPGDPIAIAPDADAVHDLRKGGFKKVLELFYTPEWIAQGKRSHLLGDDTMSLKARMLHRKANDGTHASDALPNITCPTLIMHGVDDRMVKPENSEVLHEHIKGSELWLTNGRHGFFDEFSDEVTPRVLEFFGRDC